MNNYTAWIKELSPIVYDNSKSEYQIISEIIPLLLQIKDSQNSNSELMDTIYNEIASKISELKKQMTNFTSEFNSKLEEYKTNLDTSNASFLSSLQENFNSFITTSTELINNYNKTFTNKKNEIDTLIESTNNLNSNLIQQYEDIISKINNYVPNELNNSNEIISNSIETKFVPLYLNRNSLFIDLLSVTTQPSTANINDYYYNNENYSLYKYNGTSWEIIPFEYDKIYRYNNQLYTISTILINPLTIANINQTMYCKGEEGYFIGASGNAGNITFTKNNINGGYRQLKVVTYPEDWSNSFSNLLYDEFNKVYYMIYNNTNYNYSFAQSSDLVNWEKVSELKNFSFPLIITPNGIYNSYYKYVNGNWEQLPYSIWGYANNLYWHFDSNTKNLYYSKSDDFSNSEIYCNLGKNVSDYYFDYNNDFIKLGNNFIYNNEYIGYKNDNLRAANYMIFNNFYVAPAITLLFNENIINKITTIKNNFITSYTYLRYDNYLIRSFENSRTTRYEVVIGLVLYE